MGKRKPVAAVLGCAYTGYGVIRSLAESGLDIPIVCFEREIFRPEANTNLARVESFDDESDLLEKLLVLSKGETEKPILFLTSDWFVDFFQSHRSELTPAYRIDVPSSEIVDCLLNKDAFSAFAMEHRFRIPQTLVVDEARCESSMLEEIRFPCVVKPLWRDDRWKQEKMPKILTFVERTNEMVEELRRILTFQERLVIQEWIPGGDRQVYFSLVYYGGAATLLGEFTGRKIRQYPVGTGSTACAEPVRADSVREEAIRFFDTAGYRGFGSLEYKRHEVTGEYFIMEPTVGRPDHQSYLATVNGLNMPAMAYLHLQGLAMDQAVSSRRATLWVDDQFDWLSVVQSLRSGDLQLRDIVQLLFRRKRYRFFNVKDLKPFVFACLRGARTLFKSPFGKSE